MDLAASGVLRPVAATNTLPGAPEQYVVSVFKKEIRPVSGGAVADYGLLNVQFPLDATSPIVVGAPDGRSISFRATLLVATDRVTGDSYPLGTITNSTGDITGASEVTYSKAFDSLDADLVYRYEGTRLEQFVVIRQNFDLPEGVTAEDVNVECWTEFFDTPPATTTTQTARLREATPSASAVQSTDLISDFGAVKLLPGGKAFSFGDETNTAPVGKDWADVNEKASAAGTPSSPRHFLIEMVDFQTIRPMLNALPKPQKHASLGSPRRNHEALLASASARSHPITPDTRLMATHTRAAVQKAGVVIDFALGTSVPVPPNIVSWWKAENNANDSVNSLNGTLFNGAGYSASGEVGSAFSIGGGSQYVQIPNNALLNFSTAMTLECWVYLNSYPNNDIVMIAGKEGTATHQFELALASSPGHWCFQPFLVVNGAFACFQGSFVPLLNTWYHVAMTYDGSALKLYVNGIADGTMGASGAITATSNPMLIGGYGTGPWTMNGRVDELSLYNRALSVGEIKSISDAGSAGKGNPGTCTTLPFNAVGWWPGDGNTTDLAKGNSATLVNGTGYASGAVAQGFSLDGSDDYVQIASSTDLNPTSGLTLEAWIHQTGQLYQNMPIFSKDGVNSDRQYLLTVASTGKFRIHIGTPPNNLYYTDGSTSVALNTWYHVAMTYNGSALNLFVNGAQEASIPVSGSILTTSQPLRIGGSDSGGYGNYKFQGIIDEPTVYSRALSISEITAIYIAGIGGKCKATPPSITTQPGAQTVNQGGQASFVVAASGTAPLSYQWYKNNDQQSVAGAVSYGLSFPSAQTSDNGNYYVKVSNSAGTATSQPATLTVIVPPSIQMQPTSQTVNGGAPVTFTVSASGTSPAYQWFHNGVAIPGASTASITLNGVGLADAGQYRVVVSNSGGAATSVLATLAVNQVAVPTFSPLGGSYPSARSVSITCSTPGATIHYRLDGQEPTITDPSVSPVLIDHDVTLKAKAWKTGYTTSDSEAESYRIEATPTGQPPTLTISPPTGTSLLASDDLSILVQASDPDSDGAISKIELYKDGLKVAESAQSPLQFTLSKISSGTYTFTAKAIDDVGFVNTAYPTVISILASGLDVSLQAERPYYSSSPATLNASVLGVDSGAIRSLTLNGLPISVGSGNLPLNHPLVEGENAFTLVATDLQGHSSSATTSVYLDSTVPTLTVTSPANNSSVSVTRMNVSGTFGEVAINRITVNGVPAFIAGTSWEALNVPLVVGANTLTAIAVDIAGNSSQTTVTVNGTGTLVDPVQLSATPVGGFAPLQVTFQAPTGPFPGTLLQVL